MNEDAPRPKLTGPNAAERERGLAEFIAGLQNIMSSSPEALSVFADDLQSELQTLDESDSKQAVREAIEALRRAARIIGAIPGQARAESPPKPLSE